MQMLLNRALKMSSHSATLLRLQSSYLKSQRYIAGSKGMDSLLMACRKPQNLRPKPLSLNRKQHLLPRQRTVLDSWVRYEGQVKARQQKELADTIITKIAKELENPKVLQQILQQSVTDVESERYAPFLKILARLILLFRGGGFKSSVISHLSKPSGL